MDTGAIEFRELLGIDDPLLPEWLALYETSFPANERVLCAAFLRLLRAHAAGEQEHEHLLAALCDTQFAGLADYATRPQSGGAYLVYLATVPALRGKGMGAEMYAEIVRRVMAEDPGNKGIVIEVESPDEPSTEDPEMARRRIGFYKRQGARVLGGVEYRQQVQGQRAIRMCVMVHPLVEMSPLQGLTFARDVLGGVRPLGPLAWE